MVDTIVVIGATGYLGRYIADELHRRGYRVRALARSRERAESAGLLAECIRAGDLYRVAPNEVLWFQHQALVYGQLAPADDALAAVLPVADLPAHCE